MLVFQLLVECNLLIAHYASVMFAFPLLACSPHQLSVFLTLILKMVASTQFISNGWTWWPTYIMVENGGLHEFKSNDWLLLCHFFNQARSLLEASLKCSFWLFSNRKTKHSSSLVAAIPVKSLQEGIHFIGWPIHHLVQNDSAWEKLF